MQPMKTIRDWHLDMLRNAVPVIGHLVQTTSQADATTYRDGGDGWTALEVLCHLRDWDALFLDRARMTMTQDIPVLPNPDPGPVAIEREYNQQDWPVVYGEWTQRRDLLVQYFETVDDHQWERAASHPTRGLFTLTDQLLLAAWHDMNHIEQMARILTGRTQ